MGLRNSVWFHWLRKIPVYYVCLVLVEVPKISTKWLHLAPETP